MFQTIEAIRLQLGRVLAAAGFSGASVHFMRESASEFPYVVFVVAPSALGRTSTTNLDDDVFEFHFFARGPDDAVKMLDAWVRYCRDLLPDGMPIVGARLTGCEIEGGRSVEDATENAPVFEAIVSVRFSIAEVRPPLPLA